MKHLGALRGLVARYPGWDCPPATIQAWLVDLEPLPEQAVEAACAALASESEYPPSLAAIYKRASILARPEPSGGITAGEAWSELQRNRERASWNRYESRPEKRLPYVWSSDAVRRAAESVDWRGDWEGESAGTIRAQFERYYLALVARQAEAAWKQDALEAPQRKRIEARRQSPRLEGAP